MAKSSKQISDEELNDVVDKLILSKPIQPATQQNKTKLKIRKGVGIGVKLNIPLCDIHNVEMIFDKDLSKWSCIQYDNDGLICKRVANYIEKPPAPIDVSIVSKRDVLIYYKGSEMFLRQGDEIIRLPKGSYFDDYGEDITKPSIVGQLLIPIKYDMIEIT